MAKLAAFAHGVGSRTPEIGAMALGVAGVALAFGICVFVVPFVWFVGLSVMVALSAGFALGLPVLVGRAVNLLDRAGVLDGIVDMVVKTFVLMITLFVAMVVAIGWFAAFGHSLSSEATVSGSTTVGVSFVAISLSFSFAAMRSPSLDFMFFRHTIDPMRSEIVDRVFWSIVVPFVIFGFGMLSFAGSR